MERHMIHSFITRDLSPGIPWEKSFDRDEQAMIDCFDDKPWSKFYKSINIDTLPPTSAEIEAKKKANARLQQTKDLIKDNLDCWTKAYRFQKDFCSRLALLPSALVGDSSLLSQNPTFSISVFLLLLTNLASSVIGRLFALMCAFTFNLQLIKQIQNEN